MNASNLTILTWSMHMYTCSLPGDFIIKFITIHVRDLLTQRRKERVNSILTLFYTHNINVYVYMRALIRLVLLTRVYCRWLSMFSGSTRHDVIKLLYFLINLITYYLIQWQIKVVFFSVKIKNKNTTYIFVSEILVEKMLMLNNRCKNWSKKNTK